MNIIAVQMNTGMLVSSLRRAAEPVENTAATRIPVTIVRNAMNF